MVVVDGAVRMSDAGIVLLWPAGRGDDGKIRIDSATTECCCDDAPEACPDWDCIDCHPAAGTYQLTVTGQFTTEAPVNCGSSTVVTEGLTLDDSDSCFDIIPRQINWVTTTPIDWNGGPTVPGNGPGFATRSSARLRCLGGATPVWTLEHTIQMNLTTSGINWDTVYEASYILAVSVSDACPDSSTR